MISRVNHHQKMSFSKCMSGDIFLLILLVAADQGAKWLSYLYLKGQPSVSLISGVLELHYLYPENRGIAFGMFQGSVLFFCHCECTVSGSDPMHGSVFRKSGFICRCSPLLQYLQLVHWEILLIVFSEDM